MAANPRSLLAVARCTSVCMCMLSRTRNVLRLCLHVFVRVDADTCLYGRERERERMKSTFYPTSHPFLPVRAARASAFAAIEVDIHPRHEQWFLALSLNVSRPVVLGDSQGCPDLFCRFSPLLYLTIAVFLLLNLLVDYHGYKYLLVHLWECPWFRIKAEIPMIWSKFKMVFPTESALIVIQIPQLIYHAVMNKNDKKFISRIEFNS